ncbi:hypothetical protein HanPI659440_Chr08g0308271 [Helianthus annuus]|nr:hypothetical protein HanPI659440_Chr08g0308271 [Helianthus annuus]
MKFPLQIITGTTGLLAAPDSVQDGVGGRDTYVDISFDFSPSTDLYFPSSPCVDLCCLKSICGQISY